MRQQAESNRRDKLRLSVVTCRCQFSFEIKLSTIFTIHNIYVAIQVTFAGLQVKAIASCYRSLHPCRQGEKCEFTPTWMWEVQIMQEQLSAKCK